MTPLLTGLLAWVAVSLPAAVVLGRLLHRASADGPPPKVAAASAEIIPLRARAASARSRLAA